MLLELDAELYVMTQATNGCSMSETPHLLPDSLSVPTQRQLSSNVRQPLRHGGLHSCLLLPLLHLLLLPHTAAAAGVGQCLAGVLLLLAAACRALQQGQLLVQHWSCV
jgi:hypothetical protein